MKKKCSRCKVEKSKNDFNKDENRKDGLLYYCKKCQIEYRNIYQQKKENKERQKIKRGERFFKENGYYRKSRKKILLEKINTKSKPIQQVYSYLMYDERYYKIGQSINPKDRLKIIRTANPSCKLLVYTKTITEKQLHDYYKEYRVSGEWFNLPKDVATKLISHINKKNYENKI